MNFNFKYFLVLALGFTTLFTFTSCEDDEPTKDDTLYQRLGEQEGITTVVGSFLANVLADRTISDDFETTVATDGGAALAGLLIEQICDVTGGPCTYSGLSMADAHAGMNITDADFNSLVQALATALSDNGVSSEDITTIAEVLGGTQVDIVEQDLLFDAIGGTPTVTVVVDTFLSYVVADTTIVGRFANADVPALRQALIDQISDLAGSEDVVYTGATMEAAHTGMNITDAEFDALVGHIVAAVEANAGGLDPAVVARVEAELYPPVLAMRGSIVGK